MDHKILVCTMWCGEPDYEWCVRSLNEQVGVNIEHRVIKDLPELQAHNVVYQMFNTAPADVFRAKVDADVELLTPETLLKAVEQLKTWQDNNGAVGFNAAVHDYMTDTQIAAGLTFYAPSVRFNVQKDPLACDRHIIVNEHENPVIGGPLMGRHMYHANAMTAFRYGFHRGLKRQRAILELVKTARSKYHDRLRLFAIKGFEAALSERYDAWQTGKTTVTPDKHNYNDVEFQCEFQNAVNLID